MCLPYSCHSLLFGTVPLTSFCTPWDKLLGKLSDSMMLCLELWHSRATEIGRVPTPTDSWNLPWDQDRKPTSILRSGLGARSYFNLPLHPCSGWLVPCLTPLLYSERLQWAGPVDRSTSWASFSTPLSTRAWASGIQPISYIRPPSLGSQKQCLVIKRSPCPVDFTAQGSHSWTLKKWMGLEEPLWAFCVLVFWNQRLELGAI